MVSFLCTTHFEQHHLQEVAYSPHVIGQTPPAATILPGFTFSPFLPSRKLIFKIPISLALLLHNMWECPFLDRIINIPLISLPEFLLLPSPSPLSIFLLSCAFFAGYSLLSLSLFVLPYRSNYLALLFPSSWIKLKLSTSSPGVSVT